MAAREPDRDQGQGPARPLVGYRDVGEDIRHSRGSMIRAWIILGALAIFYLGWTLIIFFLDPRHR
jgi:hypothetical protein